MMIGNMSNKKEFKITKKDLEISFFSGSGAGGQHRNKHMNCVRIRHPATGVMAVGQNYREKEKNISDALRTLASHPKIKFFLEQGLLELEGKQTIAKYVEYAMDVKNLDVYLENEKGEFVNEKTGEVLDNLVVKQAQNGG
jgi:protein subunit release factor B